MKVRSMTYSRYHGRDKVGSTRLRVDQLMKYWPEYEEYHYGENPDVMIFQKVYIQQDWQFMEHYQGIKILDICDPDWLDYQNVKQTLDAMDGAVVPTEALAEFLRQLTDKPVKVIPDRHDLENVPELKPHVGKIKSAVWFGYMQNAELLRWVIPTLEKRGISLTVLSNENPYANRWAVDEDKFKYHYQKFNDQTLLSDLQNFDICILPVGDRPRDRFKSNNRTTLAWLAGLPVVTDLESLDAMETADARNKEAQKNYDFAKLEYDCKKSVSEMKAFIEELKSGKS